MTQHVGEIGEVATRLQFRILGPVQVLDPAGQAIDIGGSKPRLVLVQLLLAPNRVVSTDALVDALWGEDPPPTARRSLQSHVAKLRAALGGDDGPLRSQSPGYVLAVDEAQIDLWRSEDLVRQARSALASDPWRANFLVRQAHSEWTSEPLGDLAEHDQLVPQRRRLDRLWLDLAELELDATLAVGDSTGAIERLEWLVVDRPEHEPFWARLMTAYYRQGRQSDALEAFQRARRALVEAFGIDPSPELQRLELAILGQAAELDDVEAPTCPYKGLASYQLDDADLFHGRDELVAELVEAVRTASFVVVVGSSGAGKSSALRAGLVKAIEARRLGGAHQAIVITPGTTPLRSIYRVPAAADVIIVDQFEELFTLTDDEAAQREFVRLLVARVNDGGDHVVISLRADFYGHCTKLPALAPLLARRQVVVGPMSEHELRIVITKPAEQAGLVVDDELVDVIVAEAANHAGALPLVSHALVETWHRRADGRLTLAAYRDAGSIAGAIARTAERVYDGFQPEQRSHAEHLFLRLVEPGEGTDHTRRKVPYGQLEGSSIAREEIDLLVEARLLMAGADGIEIAHEALIESWPRLRSWIDDDREGIRVHRHLTSSASAWDELGRDDGELYRGARLSAALSWVGDTAPDLSDLERDFIDAAVAMSENQLQQQVRANRRLRVLVAASIVGVIVAVAGTVIAARQANEANRGRAAAEAAQLVETVRGETGLSESTLIQLAVAAERRTSTLTTKGLLLDAVAHASGRSAGPDIGVQLTGDSPISANGDVLVGNDDNVLGVVLDAETLQPRVRNLRPAPTVVVDTGARLLGVNGATLETVDLQTGATVGPAPGVTARPSRYALSPDGTTLAVATETDDGGLAAFTLFDVASGRPRLTLDSFATAAMQGVTFSPNGRTVLSIVGGHQAAAWDTTSGQTSFIGPAQGSTTVTRLAMSPAGTVIAIGRDNGSVDVWSNDAGSWTAHRLARLHHEAITWIDFDSTGQYMVSTSRDGVSVVWDVTTGLIVAGPQGFGGQGGLTTFFRPKSATSLVNVVSGRRTWNWELPTDGLVTTVEGVNLGATASATADTRVLVSSPDGAAVHDPSAKSTRRISVETHSASNFGVITSGDGTRFAVVFGSGLVELHDTSSGALVRPFEPRIEVFAVVFRGTGTGLERNDIMIALDRGGTRVAFQAEDRRIYVIDDRGVTLDTIGLVSGRDALQALDLSDDGTELVVSTTAGDALWYDIAGGDVKVIAAAGSGYDGHFIDDGRISVVGKGEARIIDPRTSQPTKDLAVGDDATRFAVDPTDRLFATEDATGAIELWDAQLVSRLGEPIRVRGVASGVPIRFTADGHYLVVSGTDETSWIDVSAADWRRIACGLVTEQMSSTDRARYLGSTEARPPCQ